MARRLKCYSLINTSFVADFRCLCFVRELSPKGLLGERSLEKPTWFSKVWFLISLLPTLLSRGSPVQIRHGSPIRPRRLARPRTPAFHADNTGSNPVGDAKDFQLLMTGFEGGVLLARNSDRAYMQVPIFTVQSQFHFRFLIGQRTLRSFDSFRSRFTNALRGIGTVSHYHFT